ncbi:MAG: hypothetical protein CBD18_02415 [Opitutales bacterium TMED158]|nr:MAG: hypothetical protein CBD18_02415 [Opitutales bacterium TMED158]|tara:strand:+ start:628 stop:1185 length:558 start_codon:yes stop_codon:yes gene_type:complete
MSIPVIYLIATPAYLRSITDLDNNVEDKRVIPFMALAQDKHIQPYLGTNLYEKVLADVQAGSTTDDYVTLIDTYVRRAVCWWTMVELLPELSTRIDNVGVVTYQDAAEEGIVNAKVERARQNAHFYTERMVSYLQHNTEKYAEYNTNTEDQMRAEPNVYYQSGLSISGSHYLKDTPLRYVAFPLS